MIVHTRICTSVSVLGLQGKERINYDSYSIQQ